MIIVFAIIVPCCQPFFSVWGGQNKRNVLFIQDKLCIVLVWIAQTSLTLEVKQGLPLLVFGWGPPRNIRVIRWRERERGKVKPPLNVFCLETRRGFQ